jgi:hypothetical protein
MYEELGKGDRISFLEKFVNNGNTQGSMWTFFCLLGALRGGQVEPSEALLRQGQSVLVTLESQFHSSFGLDSSESDGDRGILQFCAGCWLIVVWITDY